MRFSEAIQRRRYGKLDACDSDIYIDLQYLCTLLKGIYIMSEHRENIFFFFATTVGELYRYKGS